MATHTSLIGFHHYHFTILRVDDDRPFSLFDAQRRGHYHHGVVFSGVLEKKNHNEPNFGNFPICHRNHYCGHFRIIEKQ